MNKMHPPGKGRTSNFLDQESWTPDPSWVSGLSVLLLVSGIALALVLVGRFMSEVQSHTGTTTPIGPGRVPVASGPPVEVRSATGNATASESAARWGAAGEKSIRQDHDIREDQLKAQYLGCASYTSVHRMDVDTAAACSRVAELLLIRIFDSDLDRQLEWWRENRNDTAPSGSRLSGV